MAAELKQESPRKRQNRFLVTLLIFAAVLSAAKDLSRVIDLTSSAAGLVAYVHQRSFAREAPPAPPAAPDCPQVLAENDRSAQPYNWNGRIAPEQMAELNQSVGEIATVPAMDNDFAVEVIRKDRDWDSEGERAARCPTVVARSSHLARQGTAQIADIRLSNSGAPRYLKADLPSAVSIVERALNGQIDSALGKAARRSLRVYPRSFQFDGRRLHLRMTTSAAETTRPRVETLSWVDEVESSDSNLTKVKVVNTTERPCTLDLLKTLRARLEAGEADNEVALDPLMLRLLEPVSPPTAQPEAEESH
jgi:hypothetical protein